MRFTLLTVRLLLCSVLASCATRVLDVTDSTGRRTRYVESGIGHDVDETTEIPTGDGQIAKLGKINTSRSVGTVKDGATNYFGMQLLKPLAGAAGNAMVKGTKDPNIIPKDPNVIPKDPNVIPLDPNKVVTP